MLDRLRAARETRRVPAPVSVLGEPHGVGNEGLKTQKLTKRGARQHLGLARLAAAHIEVEIVGEGWIRLLRGQGWQELFENEAVQGITAIVHLAAVAADESGRNEEGGAGGDVRFEIGRQADAPEEARRVSGKGAGVNSCRCRRTPSPRRFPLPGRSRPPSRARGLSLRWDRSPTSGRSRSRGRR